MRQMMQDHADEALLVTEALTADGSLTGISKTSQLPGER
jgi:hypothetical protein